MKHLHLLLPFSLPPAPLARDLLPSGFAPALARLLGNAKPLSATCLPHFARALPHEFLLAGQSDLPATPQPGPGLVRVHWQATGWPIEAGFWFMFEPVHLHFARDHLVLTDPARLDLSEVHARALFAIAERTFAESGYTLRYARPGRWFLRADPWCALDTSSIDAACGHNIDIWMPTGEHARAWRKLQNEVQMEWFAHPLQAEREAAGLLSVNSIWLSCGDTLAPPLPCTRICEEVDAPFILPDADTAVVCLQALRQTALAEDWGRWQNVLATLDMHCFTPLAAALDDGTLTHCQLSLSGTRTLHQLRLRRSRWPLSLLRHPSLELLSEDA